MNISIKDIDTNRPIVLWGWDGMSRPTYIYKDEMEMPHWQRVHIIGEG